MTHANKFLYWSDEMHRAASAVEAESDGSPAILAIIDGNRAIAEVLREAAGLQAKIAEVEEERDTAQEYVDLDVDEFQRIKAAMDDLRIGIIPKSEHSARVLYSVVAGICDRAVIAGRQRVPLIEQRDRAVADRDSLKAKLDALVEAARHAEDCIPGCGCERLAAAIAAATGKDGP